MRRISISELSSLRWSFFQDVIRYATHGFDSIGIWRQKVEDYDLLEVTDFLFEMQMNVSSVHWAGGFTGGNDVKYVEAIADAVEAIELTSRLQADCLIVHPGCRNGHTHSNARRLFSNALESLLPIAADYNVKLAIEPMPCRSANAWTFVETLESSLEFLSDFSADQLGLVLDLYHVGLNPAAFDQLEKWIHQVALVQLADRTPEFSRQERRLPLGTGDVPLEQWLSRFQELNYAGMFEIELHGSGMSGMDYHDMLSSTGDFLQQNSVESLIDAVPQQARVKRSSNQ